MSTLEKTRVKVEEAYLAACRVTRDIDDLEDVYSIPLRMAMSGVWKGLSDAKFALRDFPEVK